MKILDSEDQYFKRQRVSSRGVAFGRTRSVSSALWLRRNSSKGFYKRADRLLHRGKAVFETGALHRLRQDSQAVEEEV
jgi:hypothetical protein